MQSDAINDLLVEIPSQASSIAVSCVEQIIEGHIQNPSGLAKNIKRIASKVSVWNTKLVGHIDEAGDACHKVRKIKKPFDDNLKFQVKGLIHLPQKVRCKIWSFLDTQDLLSLRLLCKTARMDIDNEVGLPVVLDTSSDSFTWIRTITVRKCLVTRLDNHCYLNFLSRTECMKELKITQHVFIPSEIADLILRKFPSLKYLSLYTQEFFEVSPEATQLVQISPSVTSEMFEITSQKPVTKVSMTFIQQLQMTKWIVELNTAKNRIAITKCLEMSVPRHQLHQQKDCVLMLSSSKPDTIQELKCNLENMNWKCYEKPIRRNSNTLTALYLQNLSLSCGEFDCSVVEECKLLRVFTLSGRTDENERRLLKIVNVSKIPVQRLSLFDLEFVYIPDDDFSYMESHMEKSVWIRMRSSKGGQDYFIGLHLGKRNVELLSTVDSKNSRDILFAPPSDYDFRTFVQDGKVCCNNDDDFLIDESFNCEEVQSATILRIPPQLITGLLLTAYLALC